MKDKENANRQYKTKNIIKNLFECKDNTIIEWLLYMHPLEFPRARSLKKCFDTWGTNLGEVLCSHLFEYRHYC